MNSILSAIGDVLFTKTQQQVLGLLYSKPEQSVTSHLILTALS